MKTFKEFKDTCLILFVILLRQLSFVNNQCLNDSIETFDFVIIGGGTAGCILAARLSEVSNFSVVVLEAGGEPPLVSKIPSLAGLMVGSEVDWNYTSVSQKYALFNYPNHVMNMTSGKMLGGTGSLNNMNFFRGNKLNFNDWAKDGADGWQWKNVFKYFKKVENDTEIGVNATHHGHTGPICITNPGRENSFVNSFLAAVKQLGYTARDPNGDGKQTGYSYASVNVCNHQRQSTYTNYLKPTLSRTNLKVQTFAFVERILFDKFKRAVGVVYMNNGCRRTVNVTKEVIVSGGAISSPRLLMLSGIGPQKHLQSMNISVLSDLPVGENFQDHLKMNLLFTKSYEDIYNNETVKQFFEGSGPLTSFSYGNAFINTRYSKDYFYPDIQLSLRAFSVPAKAGQSLRFILRPIHSNPNSRGTIRLRSNNPYDYPIIDPGYLSDEQDVKVLAEGTKIANALMKSMNVSEYGYTPVDIFAPACDKLDKNTDEYWYCVVRNNAVTLYHFSGTCRMGAKNSSSSVVDSRLRVIGVKRLRVVDASVMPSVTSANIQAAVMMIAEKGASIIKAHHLLRAKLVKRHFY